MTSGRIFVALLGLGVLCFGVGYVLGISNDGDHPDLNESRSRIRRASLSSSRLEQTSLLLPVLETLSTQNVEALSEVFESSFVPAIGDFPLELFVASWARFDPEAARSRISSWPADMRREAWPALLGSWAHSDPQAAFAALEEISDLAVRRRALRPLIESWGSSGDAGVWQALSELTDSEQRRELTPLVVQRQLARGRREAMLREVESLADTAAGQQIQGIALASLAEAMAQTDLPEAVAFAETHWSTPHGREISRRVATHWAGNDGPAAIAWLRSRPAGDLRDLLLAGAYRSWLEADRAAATQWIADGALDSDLAHIAVTHAAALAREDPEAAIAWASALPESTHRQRSLRAIGRIWRRSDPAAAADWLESSGVGIQVRSKP